MPDFLTITAGKETLDIGNMLDKVRHYILNCIDTKDSLLQEMALYFAENQGKMVRPMLTLSCGLIDNSENIDIDELCMAAAGVEMLHMSALVHDDIIDRAKIRRGRPSINALYGKDNALLLGDYFYSCALRLMSELSQTCILKEALKVIALMVEGEIKQQRQAFDLNTSIKDYIVRITYKTASLTSLSCFAGACTAKLSAEKIRLLVKMGQDFGKAYQIRDDIMDFTGDEQHLKKPSSDLNQGTITLPVILLFKMNKTKNPHELFSYIKDGKLSDKLDPCLSTQKQFCVSKLKKAAAKKAAKYCNRFIARCIKHLSDFPPCEIKQKMVQTVEAIYIST